ncbi:HK97-gp10 family putative phage morphogenesis protein [Paucilactobacillus sp. N302-9]
MADLDEVLDEWLEQVKDLGDITPAEQAKITKAGADVYESKLQSATKEKHYSHHNDKKYGHMADHITKQATNIDGKKTGVSTVGWDNAYHAANARRLNNGTKKYSADHFVTNLQNSDSTINDVLLAEQAAYQEFLKKRGGS